MGFLLPGMLITLVLAWAYVKFGTMPAAGWLLYGIKPWNYPVDYSGPLGIGKKAVQDRLTRAGRAGVTVGLYFAGVNFVWVLLGSGLFVMLVRNRRRVMAFPLLLMPGLAGSATANFSLGGLLWTFLESGRCCTASVTCCSRFCTRYWSRGMGG